MWRVQEHRSFDALRTDGRVARGKAVWMRRIDNPRDRVELAFAVGRRFGSAVERNRFRRQCRAIVTELAKSGDLMTGIYLIGAAPQAKSLGFAELSEQIGSMARAFASAAAGTDSDV